MAGALNNAGWSLWDYIGLIYVYCCCLVVSSVWLGAAPKGSALKKDLKCPAPQTFESDSGPSLLKKNKG